MCEQYIMGILTAEEVRFLSQLETQKASSISFGRVNKLDTSVYEYHVNSIDCTAEQVVVVLRTLLQDRMADLNGRTVKHLLNQDKAAFVRLVGLSTLQVAHHHLMHLGFASAQPYGYSPRSCWL